MKILRLATLLVFAITSCIFAWFYYDTTINIDNTLPSITIEDELLKVSIHDDKNFLLQGVSAYDEKDGDLTNKVIVESISQFTDEGVCNATYAVADSNQHVAKKARKIQYTDYESPRFTLKQSMTFPVGKSIDVHQVIGAVDCIDGDISDRVIISATDYQSNTIGVFSLSLQTTNTKGDVAYLDLSIYIEEQNVRAPIIELSDYLIYVPKGKRLDFKNYVTAIYSNYNQIDESSFLISENYNPNVPGVYDVHYYVLDNLGNEEHTVLTVIVEE